MTKLLLVFSRQIDRHPAARVQQVDFKNVNVDNEIMGLNIPA